MDPAIIRTLVLKDFKLYFKDRFFAVVTILALVAYTALYFVMPSTVDESVALALYAPELPPLLEQAAETEGVDLWLAPSEEEMTAAVLAREYPVGMALPGGLTGGDPGTPVRLNLYYAPDLPDEVGALYEEFARELVLAARGEGLTLEVNEEVIGPDLVGDQIPMRDRLLPMFAIFMLLTEMMGLASLIGSEITTGTIRALLVTPMTVGGLFAAKGIMGVLLAFGQVTILMALTGGLREQPLLVLTALLGGSLLATGVAFLVASVVKDMMSVFAWGVLGILIFALPAFTVLFPGTLSGWVRAIPSYPLIDTVHRAVNLGSGWGELWPNLLMLLGWSLLFLWGGMIMLRRRFT